MKYHVFAGAGYYPIGPIEDYQDSYDDFDEAQKAGLKHIEKGVGRHEWYEILRVGDDGRLEEVESGWRR